MWRLELDVEVPNVVGVWEDHGSCATSVAEPDPADGFPEWIAVDAPECDEHACDLRRLAVDEREENVGGCRVAMFIAREFSIHRVACLMAAMWREQPPVHVAEVAPLEFRCLESLGEHFDAGQRPGVPAAWNDDAGVLTS